MWPTSHRRQDEEFNRLDAYAMSIPPSPTVRYALVHREVYVPLGCLPIQITQYSQSHPAFKSPMFNHWSISVPTSPVEGIGRHYELARGPQGYYVDTINYYNMRRGRERGSHTVGYVLPVMLPSLEAHFSRVVAGPLEFSNSQAWVCRALQGLNHPQMYAAVREIGLVALVLQMAIIAAAWDRQLNHPR